MRERVIEKFLGLPGVKQLADFERRKLEKGTTASRAIEKVELRAIEKSEKGEKLTVIEKAIISLGVGKEVKEGVIPFSNLPFGLQPIIKGDPRFQVTKSLIINPIEKLSGKDIPESIEQLLDSIVKFQLFANFLVTGVARKGKTAQKVKQVKVKRADKKDIKKLIDAAEDAIKRGDLNKQIKNIAENIKNLPPGAERNIQLQNFKSLIEELLRKDLIKSVVFKAKSGVSVTATTGKALPTSKLIIDATIFQSPQITRKGLAISGIAAKTLEEAFESLGVKKELKDLLLTKTKSPNLEKLSKGDLEKILPDFSKIQNRFSAVSEVEGKISFTPEGKIKGLGELEGRLRISEKNALNRILDRSQVSAGMVKDINKLKSKLNQAQTSFQKNVLKNRLDSLTRQLLKQNQSQRQFQNLLLSQLTKQIQKQKLRQKLKQKQILRFGRIGRIPKFKPIPFFFLGKSLKKKKFFKKKISIKKQFSVFTRKKGKDIFNKKFAVKKKARKFLKRKLAVTLRASGFITDSRGKKIKPKVSRGFRLSKTRKNVLVEKRSFRLSSGKERRDIQTAKRLKKPFKSDNSLMSKKLKRKKK